MPVPRGNPGSEPAEAQPTKQAVYDTAVRLFARNGFAATGMRELAREAGVNLATVNYFYGSKKGLLKAILEDYFAGVMEVLTASLAGDDGPDVKLRRAVAAVARYFGSVSDKMTIALTELPHDDPDITDFKVQRFKQMIAAFQGGLGGPASGIPIAVIGPAIVGLAASRFLFRPVLEKALPPGSGMLEAEGYPELIADLFVDGFSGLLAARREACDD